MEYHVYRFNCEKDAENVNKMYKEGWEPLRELVMPGDGFMGSVTPHCIMILQRDIKKHNAIKAVKP